MLGMQSLVLNIWSIADSFGKIADSYSEQFLSPLLSCISSLTIERFTLVLSINIKRFNISNSTKKIPILFKDKSGIQSVSKVENFIKRMREVLKFLGKLTSSTKEKYAHSNPEKIHLKSKI